MLKQLPLTGEIVKVSNAFVRGKLPGDTIWAARLIALVASCVKDTDKNLRTYEIPSWKIVPNADRTNDEGKRVGGVLNGEKLAEIRRTGRILLTSLIKIPRDPNDPNTAKYVDNYKERAILSKFDLRKDGIIEIGLHDDVLPEFLDLGSHFTEYGLFGFLMISSQYGQILFWFLQSWSSEPSIDVDLETLFRMLSVPDSLRRWINFRNRVLKVAEAEINKWTPLEFSWEPIRQGKAKVVGIRFSFKSAAAKKLFSAGDIDRAQRRTIRNTAESQNRLAKLVLSCPGGGNYYNCQQAKPRTQKCKVCIRISVNPAQKTLFNPSGEAVVTASH